MSHHELLAHPADIGFRAWGADLGAAFAEAVAGLADVISGGRRLAAVSTRSTVVQADDVQALLVRVLEEVLYLLDSEDWLAATAEVRLDGTAAEVRFHGDYLDIAALDDGVHVKAITYHGLEVVDGPDNAVVTVFVDL